MESIHGRFIVNRHCEGHIDALAKTGAPHIQREIDAILTIVATLPDGCLVIDAGANAGFISVPIANALRGKGTVHAFEVQRPLFQALCGTGVLNDLHNMFVHYIGLGARSEMMRVPAVDYGKPSDYGQVSLVGCEEGLPISVVSIDSLGLPRLDFLKADVEGMEADLLDGARETLERFTPWVWLEYFLSDVETLKQKFHGLDYDFYRMDDQNMLCAPAARAAESGLNIEARGK